MAKVKAADVTALLATVDEVRVAAEALIEEAEQVSGRAPHLLDHAARLRAAIAKLPGGSDGE